MIYFIFLIFPVMFQFKLSYLRMKLTANIILIALCLGLATCTTFDITSVSTCTTQSGTGVCTRWEQNGTVIETTTCFPA